VIPLTYSEDEGEVQYSERVGIVGTLSAILIICSFLLFFGAPIFLDSNIVTHLNQAYAVIGLPLVAFIFIMLQSITKFKKIKKMHDFNVGDIIMWDGHEYEVMCLKLFSLSVVSIFSGIRKTIPYSKLEEEVVENLTPSRLAFGKKPVRGYIRATHIDVMNPKVNLNDLVLRKHDGKNPMPISEWTGLLQDKGNYAGYPERDNEGTFIGYADGFETSYHILPMNREQFHAAVRIEFFFKFPFHSTDINRNRPPFKYWDTYKYLSNFNAMAIEYIEKHVKEVKKDG